MQSIREAVDDIASVYPLTPEKRDELLNSPLLTTQAHNLARREGLKVRTPAEIFAAAGQSVRQAFGMQAPSPAPSVPSTAPQPSRLEAKRALPMQPMRSGALDTIPIKQAAAQEREPRQVTVAKMRAMRGGKPIAQFLSG